MRNLIPLTFKIHFKSPARKFSDQRKPLIKFIGKRSLQLKDNSTSATSLSFSPDTNMPSTMFGNETYFRNLKDGAFHGRPKFSEQEMEVITDGGASLWNLQSKKKLK